MVAVRSAIGERIVTSRGKKRSNGRSGSDNTVDELIRCRRGRRSLDSPRVLLHRSPPRRRLRSPSILRDFLIHPSFLPRWK